MPKQSKLSPHDKTVQMAVGDLDFKRIKLQSAESGVGMIDIVNQLMHLAHLRVQSAKEGAEIDPTMLGSEIELLTLLTLHDIGLLTDKEFAGALLVAHKYPYTDVAERLAELREIVAERIEMLEPHWAERRAELANEKAKWTAEDATSKEAHRKPVALRWEVANQPQTPI